MNPILKNVLAVVIGILVGGTLNMALIMVGPNFFPLPEGVDPMDPEGFQRVAHLMEFKHYIFPFLAHALGTLVGAFLAAKIAATHKFRLGMFIGIFFLLGGIANSLMISFPVWMVVVDLALAYIPFAWVGANTAIGKK